MAGKTTQVYRDTMACKTAVLGGYLLAIDPSSGSASNGQSYPGYAVFNAGQLTEQGFLKLNGKGLAPHQRLNLIYKMLASFEQPDVLAIEMIRSIQGRFEMSLLWAVGTAVSVLSPKHGLIEVSAQTWRTFIPEGYLKTDSNDAVAIGHAVLQIAAGTKEVIPAAWLSK